MQSSTDATNVAQALAQAYTQGTSSSALMLIRPGKRGSYAEELLFLLLLCLDL